MLVEDNLGIKISSHIKNIFKYADLDNHVVLTTIGNDFDFNRLRDFVRSNACQNLAKELYTAQSNEPNQEISTENLISHYGRLHYIDKSNFDFTMGEKSIIKSIIKLLRDKSPSSKDLKSILYKKKKKKKFQEIYSS